MSWVLAEIINLYQVLTLRTITNMSYSVRWGLGHIGYIGLRPYLYTVATVHKVPCLTALHISGMYIGIKGVAVGDCVTGCGQRDEEYW